MPSFKVAGGRVVYTGRLTREPYTSWTATRDGSAAIAEVAKELGFRLFGRTRAARRQIWRELDAAARSEEGRAAMQAAADLHIRTIGTLAYAQGLPRTTVGLRRVVLIPRALVASRARAAVSGRLGECPAFASRPVRQRDFVFERVLAEVDAAARLAQPSVQRSIASGSEWSLIGADKRFQWVDQYWSGAGWTGHWFVYEQPREPLARSDRQAVEKAVDALKSSIVNLSRERRHALVQLAASA